MPDLLEGYVPDAEYCEVRRISKRQAQRERAARAGPPWVRLGREIYYSIRGFREWLADQEIKPQRAPPASAGRVRQRGEAA